MKKVLDVVRLCNGDPMSQQIPKERSIWVLGVFACSIAVVGIDESIRDVNPARSFRDQFLFVNPLLRFGRGVL